MSSADYIERLEKLATLDEGYKPKLLDAKP